MGLCAGRFRQVKKCLLAKKLAELKKSAGEQIEGMNERQFLDNIGCHKDSHYKILLGNESECKEDDLACEKVAVAVPREPMDFLGTCSGSRTPKECEHFLAFRPRKGHGVEQKGAGM